MRKFLTLVTLAVLGILLAGCDTMFNGHGAWGPDYFEGPPYYGGHSYPYQNPNQKGNPYYGDNDIGIPYYLADGILYYRIGGCYCYYRNKMRYYVETLPAGGRFCHVQRDASK